MNRWHVLGLAVMVFGGFVYVGASFRKSTDQAAAYQLGESGTLTIQAGQQLHVIVNGPNGGYIFGAVTFAQDAQQNKWPMVKLELKNGIMPAIDRHFDPCPSPGSTTRR